MIFTWSCIPLQRVRLSIKGRKWRRRKGWSATERVQGNSSRKLLRRLCVQRGSAEDSTQDQVQQTNETHNTDQIRTASREKLHRSWVRQRFSQRFRKCFTTLYHTSSIINKLFFSLNAWIGNATWNHFCVPYPFQQPPVTWSFFNDQTDWVVAFIF